MSMKDGIHLLRSDANGEFFAQFWSKGKEISRETETYKRRAGALGGAMATGRIFKPTMTGFYYWDHTQRAQGPELHIRKQYFEPLKKVYKGKKTVNKK